MNQSKEVYQRVEKEFMSQVRQANGFLDEIDFYKNDIAGLIKRIESQRDSLLKTAELARANALTAESNGSAEPKIETYDNYYEGEHTWDFVEKFYPDYDHCDSIAANNDLTVLIKDEDEDDSIARELLNETYDGDRKNPQLKIDYMDSMLDIYERSIDAYMEQNTPERKMIIAAGQLILNSEELTMLELIELIRKHPDGDDLIDHVHDEVTPWQPLEFSLTCNEFCEIVDGAVV